MSWWGIVEKFAALLPEASMVEKSPTPGLPKLSKTISGSLGSATEGGRNASVDVGPVEGKRKACKIPEADTPCPYCQKKFIQEHVPYHAQCERNPKFSSLEKPGTSRPVPSLSSTVEQKLHVARDASSPAYRFPSCPECHSFALYRRNNVGDYDCETCKAKGISELRARGIR